MLLALAGLAGAGKSTAIGIMERLGFGQRYYAGQVLRDVLASRGLALTPANERAVRTEMRENEGMEVFARLALPRLREMAIAGPVLLDSIYCVEERDLYRRELGAGVAVLAVEASRDTRASRLAVRPQRAMTIEDLARRDALELGRYRLGDVVGSAEHLVRNEEGLDELEQVLRRLLARLGA